MDAAEINAALREHEPLIKRLVSRSVRSRGGHAMADFDEAMQAGRIAAWKACQRWREDGGSKLSSLIGNHVAWAMKHRWQYWQAAKRRGVPRALADVPEPSCLSPTPDLDSGVLWDRVAKTIEPRYADMVIRRYRDGETYAAIAASYGVTRQCIDQTIAKALAWLKEAWD